jgi:hypothetical protein
LVGQIVPAPDARLNYTQIMFEHDRVKGASEYLIEVKQVDDNDSTFLHPTVRHKDSSTATMLSNFEFGKKYMWRYTGLDNGKQLGWHGPYNFEISKNIHVNKDFYRTRVIYNDSSANAGGLIVMDMTHSIVDRDGNFVWYLPPDTEKVQQALAPHSLDVITDDMRMSPFGTITCIISGRAQEKDLKGKLLWQAPLMDSVSDSSDTRHRYHYHHCFQRLSSGNYMALDRDSVYIHIDTGYVYIEDEIIREFDKNKNQVWSWSSEHYLDSIEIKKIIESKSDSGILDPTPGGHLNAFYADEENGYVYAGFRNISRIIRIEKKTGKVVSEWGEGMKNGDGFFSKQHGVNLLSDGSIVLFNNGGQDPAAGQEAPQHSSVVNFSQPSGRQNSQLIWKFDCTLDSVNYHSRRGGNVDELKNGNLLVCMGTVNRIFEISRNKKIVWSAIIERKRRVDPSWQHFPLNRAHYTSSLYPYYFTIQSNTDTLYTNDKGCKLRIFNDGTEADSYSISINDLSGGIYKTPVTSPVIASHASLSLDIPTDGLAAKTGKIEVTVRSKTNTDLIRSVFVQSIAK